MEIKRRLDYSTSFHRIMNITIDGEDFSPVGPTGMAAMVEESLEMNMYGPERIRRFGYYPSSLIEVTLSFAVSSDSFEKIRRLMVKS